MNDKFESDLPTPTYWITELNTTAVKSPYAIRFTLPNKPNDEEEIRKWLSATFGSAFLWREDSMVYAQIFFKSESDATMFILMWGDSFV